ncbi:HAMP domain-containing histidine kinase [Streptomyces sp. GMY01]|uniref:sensor histidine kinase n=1 Tax=Streptomyces sp. GMY02 TaxID=1333528 RepID=UPI00146CCF85|nr:HAMP domain-containing sensor histidine kinase [Streptomyces sp. GMY02]NMO34755.1 HAMP domain-containing histidine kinase [Streptomyces sp. GMY02]
MTWPRRLRPRSLRSRLVLIAGLLATCAVVLCQIAGLTVVRSWLTDQVDDRLAHFRPPAGAYLDIADGGLLRRPSTDTTLPSDYRVFFYDQRGRLLGTALGDSDTPGPRLPEEAADLHLTAGRPGTLASEDSSGSAWRAVTYSGPDRMRAVVALPLDTVDGATTKLLWVGLALGAAVAAGVVVLGNVAVRLGLRPLTRVERTAQRITEGALGLKVPVADPDTEVGRLSLALNTMLDRLRTALHRTETSERQLRRFMADAGHELRTPLTAIQGFAELLLEEERMSDARRHEAHTLLNQNAERMSRLVDDLFLLAKLGESPHPHRETVDLLSLAADAIATTAVRHPRRAITLEPLGTARAGHDPDLDIVETTGDPYQLAQVMGNLLSNACTHTPLAARVRVRVGAAHAGENGLGADRGDRVAVGPPRAPGTPLCVVEVSDDGPGIDPGEAARVFDRFYRAEPLGTRAAPGSGLGLAIAAAIAEAHDGRLELDTRPGEGCTFRLLLPAPSPGAEGPAGAGRADHAWPR